MLLWNEYRVRHIITAIHITSIYFEKRKQCKLEIKYNYNINRSAIGFIISFCNYNKIYLYTVIQ